jgi:hypothetical protein
MTFAYFDLYSDLLDLSLCDFSILYELFDLAHLYYISDFEKCVTFMTFVISLASFVAFIMTLMK